MLYSILQAVAGIVSTRGMALVAIVLRDGLLNFSVYENADHGKYTLGMDKQAAIQTTRRE
jgi:hypothetical protein